MPLFRTQSAAKQTSLAPHDSKARLRVVANRRRFMAKPCTPHPIPQAAQLFELQTANVRGRGGLSLPFSGGFKGGILFGKRIPPLVPRRARRSPFAPVRKSGPFSLERISPFAPCSAIGAALPPALSCRKSKSDGFFSRRFSICITAKPFCCRGWPSCAALC